MLNTLQFFTVQLQRLPENHLKPSTKNTAECCIFALYIACNSESSDFHISLQLFQFEPRLRARDLSNFQLRSFVVEKIHAIISTPTVLTSLDCCRQLQKKPSWKLTSCCGCCRSCCRCCCWSSWRQWVWWSSWSWSAWSPCGFDYANFDFILKISIFLMYECLQCNFFLLFLAFIDIWVVLLMYI